LDDKAREFYKSTENKLFKVCPNVMSRKIGRANVQQAFTLSTVLEMHYNKLNKAKILCVGCFEDPSFEYLSKNGFDIIGVDPAINYSLHALTKEIKYDIIFSTSVIEHVENDEEFIADICDLLNKDGIAILTCDFNKNYKKGDSVPATVTRQYTEYDLKTRLNNVLSEKGCSLLMEPDWSGEPEFVYQGHKYNFATYVFIKE
jgi:hypothetical protein